MYIYIYMFKNAIHPFVHPRSCNPRIFLSFHHSFSTAYQCIYYSPEHTAKAQEVLSTMSLLQPLITSLADQLLQAAQEHSSAGLRDALKGLSDKVRQSYTHPPIEPPPPFPFSSAYCNTQSTSFILRYSASLNIDR